MDGLIRFDLDSPLMEFDWQFQDSSSWMVDQRN